jgi:hypothetical protein
MERVAWGTRRRDARWLLIGLAFSLLVFLVAISRNPGGPPQTELPLPPAQHVALGRPVPTAARMHVGDFLAFNLSPGADDRYGTVIPSATGAKPILEVTSSPVSVPMLQAVATGSTVVTVLLEPHCPDEGPCNDYRRNLGEVRVTVDP